MEPMYLSIQQIETGKQIKKLLVERGYTVKDVQNAMGFENPQAVYKWISGRSLPSLDNFIILSRLLRTSIEDILVIDGDFVHFIGNSDRISYGARYKIGPSTICSIGVKMKIEVVRWIGLILKKMNRIWRKQRRGFVTWRKLWTVGWMQK